jgi:FAD/FMN-containing dehydrogenase
MLALRPSMPVGELPKYLPLLRRIGAESLEAGGRIYLMSLDLDLDAERFLSMQWGEASRALRALKARFDPRGLLNRGLLPIG